MQPTETLPVAVRKFDSLPDSALVDIDTICTVAQISRATVNRFLASGRLTRVKVGASTRARVSEVRQLIQAAPMAA